MPMVCHIHRYATKPIPSRAHVYVSKCYFSFNTHWWILWIIATCQQWVDVRNVLRNNQKLYHVISQFELFFWMTHDQSHRFKAFFSDKKSHFTVAITCRPKAHLLYLSTSKHPHIPVEEPGILPTVLPSSSQENMDHLWSFHQQFNQAMDWPKEVG